MFACFCACHQRNGRLCRVLLILVCSKASDRNTRLQLRESEAAWSYARTLKPPNIYVQFQSKLMSGQALLHEAGKEKVNLDLVNHFCRKLLYASQALGFTRDIRMKPYV